MNPTILVTGSSGFIGSNFIRLSQEYNIREADLLLTQPGNIDFNGVSTVLHLAALVHQMGGASEELYFKVNRDLAYETAKAAKESGVSHFILMSTVKVYGESNSTTVPLNEFSDCHPSEPYGKSKLEAEILLRQLESENFKIAVVRSPLVYGAGVKANMLNLVKLVDKAPVLPFAGISNVRSMVYVGNLVSLFKRIIDSRASGIFIAGDSYPLSTTELVASIAHSLQKKIWLFTPPYFLIAALKKLRPSLTDRLFGSFEISNSETNRILSHEPPYTPQEGIQEMVSWYIETRNLDS